MIIFYALLCYTSDHLLAFGKLDRKVFRTNGKQYQFMEFSNIISINIHKFSNIDHLHFRSYSQEFIFLLLKL